MRHKGVSFNQLDDRNMGRIRYQKVSESAGEVVPAEHIVKGVEVSRGRYVLVDPDELAPFVPLATKSIDVELFVDLGEIDPVFFESTYYVAPTAGAKPYALLVRALRSTGKVAIVRFVMRSRQYTAALRAVDDRLTMSTLAYADELVSASEVEELDDLDAVEVSEREVKMAEMLVKSSTARSSFVRSRIDPDTRATIEAVDGVAETGGLGLVRLGARVPGSGPRDLAATALFGYELTPTGVPDPPPTGEVYADEVLRATGSRRGWNCCSARPVRRSR